MRRVIPPFRYAFTAEDADFVAQETRRLLKSGDFLTLGRWNAEFEEAFRLAHGAAHAVAVASGTAALEILLRASGVSGKRVIAPSNTFGATLVSIERAGGTPLLADCGEDFSLAPDAVEALLAHHADIGAVVVVHLGGTLSANLPRLAEICRRHGVDLLEDAAHATGAALNGRFAGSFGRGGAFSFFSTKVITSGEGGMILTGDGDIADFARLIRDHAKRPDGGMDITGYNWRLSELQALLGFVQTRRLDAIIEARSRIAAGYAEALRGLDRVTVLRPPAGARSNHYKLVVRLPAEARAPVKARLDEEFGVAMGGEIYAVPCHAQPAFAAFAAGPLPVTEAVCAGHVCPPIYPDMSEADLAYSAQSLARVLEREIAPLPAAAGR